MKALFLILLFFLLFFSLTKDSKFINKNTPFETKSSQFVPIRAMTYDFILYVPKNVVFGFNAVGKNNSVLDFDTSIIRFTIDKEKEDFSLPGILTSDGRHDSVISFTKLKKLSIGKHRISLELKTSGEGTAQLQKSSIYFFEL